MKKCLIFADWGSIVPDTLAKIIEEFCRLGLSIRKGEIINKIEAEAITKNFNGPQDIYKTCAQNPDKIYKLTDDAHKIPNTDIYVGYRRQTHTFATVHIVSIDETKKWVIDEYDGAESIRELPEYELADSELNIYKEKEKSVS